MTSLVTAQTWRPDVPAWSRDLHEERVRRGLTQAELAEQASGTLRAVRSLEEGRIHHPQVAARIAAHLGFTLAAVPIDKETT